ncbi:MAG: IS1182 family transposase, partial [Bacteroidetes bacterium]|nr:IS1182 family transposase [Bacteroidota bacterium]
MAKRQDLKVIFKQHDQNQLFLLPPSLDELVSKDHPVRVVSAVLDKIDIGSLIAGYKPGGT